MHINVGDKVKFLNEEGGGVVREIVDQKTVLVSIPEGFDIPVSKGDLILLEPEASGGQVPFPEGMEGGADTPQPRGTAASMESREDLESREALKERVRASAASMAIPGEAAFYLAFEADLQKPLMVGDLDVYLVNNTGDDVCYILYLDQQGMVRVKHGVISHQQRHFLQTISREEISRWCKGWIQLIMAASQFPPPAPENTGFKIRPSRFFSAENYKVYPGRSNPVFLYCLSRTHLLLKADQQQTALREPASKGTPESHPPLVSRKAIIDKYMVDDEEAQVDLHIEQLSEDHYRMNAMEKLNRQLSFFQRILQSAIVNKVKRLVIIHGVGAGILKAEVRRELQQYDYIDVEDAPIARYGVGATIAKIYQ